MQVTEIHEYRNSNCEILGLATSGVPMEELDEVNGLLGEQLGKEGINYIGALTSCKDSRVVFVLLFLSFLWFTLFHFISEAWGMQ
jgi:hypothetical protein